MQITARITAVRRRPNTPSGNPVWVLEWINPDLHSGRDWARTAPDSTVGHRITPQDVGKVLTLTLSDSCRSGRGSEVFITDVTTHRPSQTLGQEEQS